MDIEGVVLAAGLSSRAGCFKMTLELGSSTVIEKCIEGMYDLCSRIIVVGGYRIDELSRVLYKYQKVRLVVNSHYEAGMFSSVKEGFRHVQGDRFFFIPGDYPMVSKRVYDTMASTEGDIIVPVYHGKNGHPILMKGQLAGELVENKDISNLREFIAKKGYVQVDVPEPGILMDIDTMDDYKKMALFYPRK